MPEFKGYIVRSHIEGRPAVSKFILCTNGEFIHEDFIGPGTRYSARIYKTEANARKVRNGRNITVERYEE